MSTVLIAGSVLLALLAAALIVQWSLRRREFGRERNLPHVAELEAIALRADEVPSGFHIDYRGPLTNDRLAFFTDDPDAALAHWDDVGRVIGYRQAFRDPRTYGELLDVVLNNTVRRGAMHRMLSLDLNLYEDDQGAQEATELPPPDPTDVDIDDPSLLIRAVEISNHGLPFDAVVRRWSRFDAQQTELQRKLEVHWRNGRVGCIVAGDSDPPGGVTDDEVYRYACLLHDRAAAAPITTS